MNRTLKTASTCLLLSLFAAACRGTDSDTAGFGPANDSPSTAPISVGHLPEPTLRRIPAPALDADQARRKIEVESFIATQYQGYRIVETTQTYSGDIIDWIDPTTVPGSDAEPPPRPSAEEMALPPGVELQPTELDLYPELRGPAGTIPMTRPTFDNYVLGSTAGSIEEYIAASVAPGQPYGQNRLYAGKSLSAANTSVAAFVNEFGGAIEPGTFSLIEVATVCRGVNPATDLELVGIVVSRDRVVFSDSTLRVRVEFQAAGSLQGNLTGGWDGAVTGFVPYAGRPYGPNTGLAASQLNGPQYESRMEVVQFNGAWWVAHNGNWLGYYPAYLFNLINGRGCEAAWYGEVYDPTPADWTWSNLGSGLFASNGNGRAAHVRKPYFKDPYGVSRWPDGAVPTLPSDSACYSASNLANGGTNWERYFYLGGPGGEAVGCN